MSIFTNEVLGPLTDAELRATAIPVDGSAVTQPVSGTVAVSAVSGTVTVDGSGVTQPVSGTVAVSAVSGTVTVDGSGVTQPVSGSVSVSNFPATQPVSGTVAVSSVSGSVAVTGPLTDTELRATPVPISGTVSVSGSGTATATVTRVAVDNLAAATVSASNAARQKVIIYNEGGTLYVKYGAAASITDYTYRMTVDTTLEIETYTGLITARKASGSTFVQVTTVGI
jgi:hypothetical protein